MTQKLPASTAAVILRRLAADLDRVVVEWGERVKAQVRDGMTPAELRTLFETEATLAKERAARASAEAMAATDEACIETGSERSH